MSNRHFEIVEHTADWALRVFGRDLAQLLIHAAEGMATLLVEDPSAIPSGEVRRVELDAGDAESLLVEWLSELAYWAEMEQLIFTKFELSAVAPTHLEGTVHGGRAPELQKHIKAVTYHNLQIIQSEAGLEATVVFDV